MVLLAFFVLVGSFSGCSTVETPVESGVMTEQEQDLWIVLDGCDHFVTDLVSSLAEDFLQTHEGLTLKVESLTNAEEREIRLEQLRLQIMAGKGPDVYILSPNRMLDPLFSDIALAMGNGLFMDISQYYDADVKLDKAAFAETVMEAGVLDNRRYVLPLRFNFPVAYVNTEVVDAAEVGKGLSGLVESAERFGRETLVTESNFFAQYFLSFFPEAIDYSGETVLLKMEEVAEFLSQYRSLTTAMCTDVLSTITEFGHYTADDEFWAIPGVKYIYDHNSNLMLLEDTYCMSLSSLNDLVVNMRIAKVEGMELAAIPMTAQDGKLTATVTLCGAVGANCKNPALAYEFLSRFLLKESQWNNDLSYYADGWPVFIKESWTELNSDIFLRETKMGQNRNEEVNKRRSALRAAEMTQADFDVLNVPIGSVRFPIAGESNLMEAIDSLLNPARNADAMEVDVEELAEDIIWELRWHLAEG